MPPHSDAVVNRAILDSWQSGLIALVSLVVLGLICWAIPFIVHKIYGKDGYRDREAKAREKEAERQVNFIDSLQHLQEQRELLCGRHAHGLEVLGDNMKALCDTLCEHGRRSEGLLEAMFDSDGLGGFQQRVEVSVVELADLAMVLFDRPWDQLTNDEKSRVKSRIDKVRKRHDRGSKKSDD